MRLLSDLKTCGRFIGGFRSFLRDRISPHEAAEIIRRRLAEREDNFLRLMERGIFGYPRSPYRPLLEMAGCELGDIRKMVRKKGLEGTLSNLHEAGVYITFEEFKGRRPIVRGDRTIPVSTRDFDNPYVKAIYEGTSGGSTGAGTRVTHDLVNLTAQSPFSILGRRAHGVLDVPTAVWLGVLPDGSGLANVLLSLSVGNVPRKWFAPNMTGGPRPSLRHRFSIRYIVEAARLMGSPLPRPEPVPLERADVVASWAEKTARELGSCLVITHPSKAVRTCLAAKEAGLILEGVTFMGGGEAPTAAKVRAIEESGARFVPYYPFSETGLVGMGCARPAGEGDVHLLRDSLAMIQHPRLVPGTDLTVPAFNFTSLLPTALKLMLNVESDDYWIVEERRCGCPLEEVGYAVHLSQIRSFRKLTGEGVTLVGSEMEKILEELLPSRFGGSPLDYQLLEEEDEKGLTRLCLLVSPRVEISDENAVTESVLDALGRGSAGAGQAGTILNQAGALRVKRAEPVWTERGKLMPMRSPGLHQGTADKQEGSG